jgi:hypothetical protein
MLHACAARFDVIKILKSFWILSVTKQSLNLEEKFEITPILQK